MYINGSPIFGKLMRDSLSVTAQTTCQPRKWRQFSVDNFLTAHVSISKIEQSISIWYL